MDGKAFFIERMRSVDPGLEHAHEIGVLQVNVGNRCNMACGHCHVRGSDSRFSEMDAATADEVIAVLERERIPVLDITGGAPELNPIFRTLVSSAVGLSCHVMARTNLTVFFEEGMSDLPGFYAAQGVHLIASLPCYTEENVDRARGAGVFERSIAALKALNDMGYGSDGLALDLVYNPDGPFLPGPQSALEGDYRRELFGRYGIVFERLYAVSNMPIGRFGDSLKSADVLDAYLAEAAAAFNPSTLPGLMCRHLISVGPDGTLFDCDFNQAAGRPLLPGYPGRIDGFDRSVLAGRRINFQEYCLICASGGGSS